MVSADWDFEGKGTFSAPGKIVANNKNASSATLKTTYTYTKPGTYFVTLRSASQREGDNKTPFARIRNLARVRVVVK